MKPIILILMLLSIATPVFSQADEHPSVYVDMSNPYTIDDNTLTEEARKEGIPEDEIKYYVVQMKQLNQAYQNGAFTKTEYVGRKRNLIEYCK